MIEVRGNLWTFPAQARIITTNGFIKKNGECVMGRGCAQEAKTKWPDLPLMLGQAIQGNGNEAFWFPIPSEHEPLITFPVKHKWFEKADLDLIRKSATKIAGMTALKRLKVIVLPRPGCGNGQLLWEDVKPVLEPILDDRFHVITF